MNMIPNKVWKYGRKDLKEWAWMCNMERRGMSRVTERRVRSGEKQSKGEKVKDYGGVTLIPTLYESVIVLLKSF